MSASASQSKTETTSVQQSVQGASGDKSPTLTGHTINYEDAGGEVSLAALGTVQDLVKLALENQGELNQSQLELLGNSLSEQSQANARASDSGNALLGTILAANQQLAQNSQSDGATAAMEQTNYLIWGLMALAGLLLWKFAK